MSDIPIDEEKGLLRRNPESIPLLQQQASAPAYGMPINYAPPHLQHDGGHPFSRHGASESLFMSIRSEKLKSELMSIENQVYSKNRSNQNMLTDRMTSQELLAGLLFPGEEIIPLPPMMLGEVRFEDMNMFRAVAMLTNHRVILMKVDAVNVSTLTKKEDKQLLLRETYTVSNDLYDGVWYYPIPMVNLSGVSLEVKFESGTQNSLEHRRPWWALLICFAALLCGFIYFVESNPYIVGGIALFVFLLGLAIFSLYSVYRKPNNSWTFSRKSRVLKIGYKDPLTQKPTVATWVLDHNYPLQDAKYFIAMLQRYAVHLCGVPL